ncbi:MAG: hypothetical protein Q8S84_08595 [bacterium]|nr:hypothetical protein [bacterium]
MLINLDDTHNSFSSFLIHTNIDFRFFFSQKILIQYLNFHSYHSASLATLELTISTTLIVHHRLLAFFKTSSLSKFSNIKKSLLK